MTNKLLAVIAINLTILTGLMVLQNVPTAEAEVAGMDRYDLQYDYDFEGAVEDIVEDCEVYIYESYGEISC